MKTLAFLAVPLLLAFIFVFPEVSIVFLFSPIIFASLNRGLNTKKI